MPPFQSEARRLTASIAYMSNRLHMHTPNCDLASIHLRTNMYRTAETFEQHVTPNCYLASIHLRTNMYRTAETFEQHVLHIKT
jgi:hypothetical protein